VRFEVVAQVCAAIDVGTAATAAAEDVAEDVAEGVSETAEARCAGAHPGVGIDPGVAVLVIGGAFAGIAKNLVGFLGLLEQLL